MGDPHIYMVLPRQKSGYLVVWLAAGIMWLFEYLV